MKGREAVLSNKASMLVIGFAGYSDSGKTTLAAGLVEWLRSKGKRIAVIKHDGHGHYKEAAGTDSDRFLRSGAELVAVVSPRSTVTISHQPRTLQQLLAEWADLELDLVVVEGFKQEPYPKIAVFRTPEQADILQFTPEHWIAAVSGFPFEEASFPILDWNDPDSVYRFVEQWMDCQ